MTDQYENQIKELYQKLPKKRLPAEKQRQIWAGITEKLDQPAPRWSRFPKGLVIGTAAVLLALIIFVPVILQSTGLTLGASLQETIRHSPYMENVKTILAERKVKGGVLVFYQRKNSENERSALNIQYVKKTIFGGWKVAKLGGGSYGSSIKQPLYFAYGPGNGHFQSFYGEIKDPYIRSIEILNQKGEKNDSVTIFSADHGKRRLWYALIDPAKGPKFQIIGIGKDGDTITTMHYNMNALSGSSSSATKSLSPFTAIQMVIDRHPEFPKKPGQTITVKKPTGGPEGSYAKVDLTTTVFKKGMQTFIVTFTKDWHVSVNGTHVKSVYKYLVTPYEVKPLKKVDRDGLINEMK